MTTRAELLSGLRLRLNDTAATRWQDDELLAYLSDAARDYSKYFPLKKELETASDGSASRYDAPSDLIDDEVLEITLIDSSTQKQETIPHKQIKRLRSPRFYEVIGRVIAFGFIPELNKTIRVRYNAWHDMPATDLLTIPQEDEDMIYAYSMAAAWQRIGGNDAGLSRWKDEGKRDDSPIIPHYVRLWGRYQRLVDQKQSTPHFLQKQRAKGRWRDIWD